MDPKAQKQGIICWVSTVTGKTGRGQPLPFEEARQKASEASSRHPLIVPTVEEVQ
jgi:hypothetical protein